MANLNFQTQIANKITETIQTGSLTNDEVMCLLRGYPNPYNIQVEINKKYGNNVPDAIAYITQLVIIYNKLEANIINKYQAQAQIAALNEEPKSETTTIAPVETTSTSTTSGQVQAAATTTDAKPAS